MKLVLTRNEVKELREFANTIEEFNGMPVNRVKELLDKTITRKAYMITIFTGQVTIELNQDLVLEFLALTRNLTRESIPVFRAIYNLGLALNPVFEKYEGYYQDLVDKYEITRKTRKKDRVETSPWSVKSISTEVVSEREVC